MSTDTYMHTVSYSIPYRAYKYPSTWICVTWQFYSAFICVHMHMHTHIHMHAASEWRPHRASSTVMCIMRTGGSSESESESKGRSQKQNKKHKKGALAWDVLLFVIFLTSWPRYAAAYVKCLCVCVCVSAYMNGFVYSSSF